MSRTYRKLNLQISSRKLQKEYVMGELFEEQDFQTLFMDVLIYISGQEVSGSLTSNVSYTYAGNDGTNTASFTLANPLNQFVLTSDNLRDTSSGSNLDDDLEEPQFGGTGIWSLDGMYDETIKKNIYEYKRDSPLNVADPKIEDNETGIKVKRWPLQAGDLIFNKHDPVRIFMHDPRTEEDSWLPVFAGFIDDPGNVTQDYITGISEFQVTCYDIRGLMQKMRVQMNPVIGMVVPDIVISGEQFFADFIINEQSMTNPFANTKFEEVIEQLMIGSVAGVKLPPSQSGVGEFNLGNLPETLGTGATALKTEGPDQLPFDDIGEGDGARGANWKVRFDPEDSLEAWNDLILFGYDTGTGANIDADAVEASLQPWTRAKVETWGRTTLWDGIHSPAKQKLYILLPDQGNTGANNLVEFEHALGGGDTREWKSRFFVIAEIVDLLDYNWIVSGTGDMFFEFPMWDFEPDDFGIYTTSYQVSKHLIDDELAEEDGEPTTLLIATGGVAFKNADFVSALPVGIQPRAIVASPTMMTKYGALSPDAIPFPFTANLESLMNLALVEFQKRLSNIGKMTMKFSWRPFLLLNRPILNEQRNRMATITAITSIITPNGMSELEIGLKYIRRPDDNGQFRLLTGGTDLAASYRRRWEKPFENQGNGIRLYPDLSSTKEAKDFTFKGAGIQQDLDE